MATSPWRLPLDRAVRYAVSDALASVKSYVYDLEYSQRQSSQEVITWNNYLADLRDLHQLLLNLPSLETAAWLTDDDAYNAPTFTPFVNGIADAKTSIRRVHGWLLSLPHGTTDHKSERRSRSISIEQEYYFRQIDKALTQLQLMPTPGSEAWYTKYEPAVEKVASVKASQQPRERAVA
ncbi:hypothetical protein Lepto7375DRAFT_2965 [Leptolyngbya sp. PCC 7375]|nr:hypothetical protein Lepto7375DRAFT_2965 [Leptolyngbya sp. PCC 7375]